MGVFLNVSLLHQGDEMILTTKGNESYDVLTQLVGMAGAEQTNGAGMTATGTK